MLNKNLLLSLALLIIVALIGAFPLTTRAQQRVGENFIFINYVGQEMTFDLDDVTYIIPGTDTVPDGGRLVLNLASGEHKYAANVPGTPLGSAGEFTIMPGEVVAKAARIEKSNPAIDRNGIVLAEPKDKIFVFDFDPLAMPAEGTPGVDTWQPAVAQPGMGSLAWINYWGRDELTLDLNGALYKVPPATDQIPGRLQIDLVPGLYRYTVSVPNGSLNGEISVVTGQVTGLNVAADPLPEPKFEVGEKSPLPLPVMLHLFEEDLTTRTQEVTGPDAAPATLPQTGGELTPVVEEPSPLADGLLVKNFAGDALIFTIDNQTHVIDQNATQTLMLPPGRYHYTASLPFVATTGTVDLAADPSIELSIAINVQGDVLSVYQN